METTKYNRSLSGVPEIPRRVSKMESIRDPVRRNLTSLYNDAFGLKRKQERIKRSLNGDIDDKENIPQCKTKIYTLPQESTFAQIKIIDIVHQDTQLLKPYTNEIFDHLKELEKKSTPQDQLKQHNISQSLRAKMVDWMVEVLCSYKCSDQTFFIAVRILDFYFVKSERQLEVSDLHLSGVTSMFIAAKYEEIHPMKLQVVHDKIAHKKLSIDQIKKKESEILQTIGFDLCGATIYEQYNLILQNCQIEEKLPLKHYRYLKKLCLYLAKMILYEYDLCSQHKYTLLGASLIFVGFKIVEQLETNFNAELQIKEISLQCGLEHEQLIEVAAKVLNLAKNFEKQYPNLENLKKFNGFQLEEEQ
ncbi:hypothetical protein pb186bvf_017255 [Paramecium bursaria]